MFEGSEKMYFSLKRLNLSLLHFEAFDKLKCSMKWWANFEGVVQVIALFIKCPLASLVIPKFFELVWNAKSTVFNICWFIHQGIQRVKLISLRTFSAHNKIQPRYMLLDRTNLHKTVHIKIYISSKAKYRSYVTHGRHQNHHH